MTLVFAAGIDWFAQIVDQVNNLITSGGGALVPISLQLLAFIAFGKLLLMVCHMLLRHALDMSGGWHTSVHFSEVLILLFQCALATFALNHWMIALPGTALSLHQLPTAFAKDITGIFDATTMDNFNQYVADTVKNLKQPSPLQVLDVLVYLWVLIQMGMLELAMYVVNAFGFVGVGVMTVLGPLFIPLALTRQLYGWFWNWLQLLVAFSAYRVMATAIGWVWANVMINFFVHGVGTDYSLANWIALLPQVLMLEGAFLFSMFKIPSMTSQLFSGAGSIGQSYVSAIGGAMRAAAAAI